MATQIYDGCIAYLESKDAWYNTNDLRIHNIYFDGVRLKFRIELAYQSWLTDPKENIIVQVYRDNAYISGVAVNNRNEASQVSVYLSTQDGVELLKTNIFTIRIAYNTTSGINRNPFVFKCIPITIDACGISTYQGNLHYILTKTTVMGSYSTDALDDFDTTYSISLEGNAPYKEAIYDKVNRGVMLLESRQGTKNYEIQIDYRTPDESFYSTTTKPFKMVFNYSMVEDNTLNLDYLSAYINDSTGKVTMVLPEVYSGGFGSVYLSNYNTKVFYLRNQFPKLLDFFDESRGFVISSSYELFSKTVYSDADIGFERMEATGISFSQKTDTIINAVGFVISITPNNSDYVYPQTFIMDQRNLSLTHTLTITSAINLYTIASYSSIIGDYRLLSVSRSSTLPTIPLKFISKGEIDVCRDKLFLVGFNSYLNTNAQPEQLALYLTNDGKEILARGDIEQGTAIKNLLNPITTPHLKSLFSDLPVGSNVSDKIQYNFALQLGNQNNTTNPVWVILEEYDFGTINFDFYEIKQLVLEITYAKDFVDDSYVYETKTYDFNNTNIEENQNTLVSKKSVVSASFSCDDYVLDSGKFRIRTEYTGNNSHGSMVNAENSSVVSPNFNDMTITGKLELAGPEDPSMLFTPIYTDVVTIQFRFRSIKKPIVTTGIYQGLPTLNMDTVESEFDIEHAIITLETDHYIWSHRVTPTRYYSDVLFMDLLEKNIITVTQYTDDDTGLASEPVKIRWYNHVAGEQLVVTNPVIVFFDTTNNDILPFILDKDPDINTTVSYPNSTTVQEFNTNSPFVIHDNLKEIKTSISGTLIKGWHKYFNLSKPFSDYIPTQYDQILSAYLDVFRDNRQKYLVMIARPDHYSLFGEIIDSSIIRSTDNSYTVNITHLATNDTARLKEIGVTLKDEG